MEVHQDALSEEVFEDLKNELDLRNVERAFRKGLDLYKKTFWISFAENPKSRLDELVRRLFGFVDYSDCVGVEWWLSVQDPNATPYWLLRPHFDREDISEGSERPIVHPRFGSVLFLRTLSYGELVIFDQRLDGGLLQPERPNQMNFVPPVANKYCVFPGDLLHGVMGRLWREEEQSDLRISLGVNYWPLKPNVDYIMSTESYRKAFEL